MDTLMLTYRCSCGYVASGRSTAALNEMIFDHKQAASSMAVAALLDRPPIDSAAAHRAMRPGDGSEWALGSGVATSTQKKDTD